LTPCIEPARRLTMHLRLRRRAAVKRVRVADEPGLAPTLRIGRAVSVERAADVLAGVSPFRRHLDDTPAERGDQGRAEPCPERCGGAAPNPTAAARPHLSS